jgi:hypothetical protein
MAAFVFDTLLFSKKLIEAGVPQRQAEVHAQAMLEIIEEKLVSKIELNKTEEIVKQQQLASANDLAVRIEKVRTDLELKIEKINANLELKIAELRSDMMKWIAQWVVGVSVLQAGVIIACIKFIH